MYYNLYTHEAGRVWGLALKVLQFMAKKRLIWKPEISEEPIRVGVVGNGPVVEVLQRKLEEKGCVVFVSPALSTLSTQMAYLFIFQDFENAYSLFSKSKYKESSILLITPKLRSNKLLRLEAETQKVKGKNVRLLKIGEAEAWVFSDLAETCMWAMFTKDAGKVIDFSKEYLDRPKQKRKDRSIFKLPEIHFSSRVIKIFIFIFILVSPIFVFLTLFLFSSYQMYEILTALSRNDFGKTARILPSFQITVSIQNRISQILAPTYNWPPFSHYKQYVKVSEDVLSFSNALLSTRQNLIAFKKAYDGGRQNMDRQIQTLSSDIGVLDSLSLQLLQDMSLVQIPFVETRLYVQKLRRFSNSVTLIKEMMPFAEGILTFPGRTKYLVLFQNNTELRPTGGFIGSFALVDVENGRIDSYSFHDVYEADGQLKAHVDPPLPIREYLKQPNWFLRDSNFDPDFSISAQQAMWFLREELGEEVSGVVAINLNVVSRVLDVLNGVYLSDYRDFVTSENFLIKATFESQKDFFPGSTAKKDFLRSLGNAIVYAFRDSKSIDYIYFLDAFKESLEKKDILIYFKNAELQEQIEEKGWGGRVVDVSCTSKSNNKTCFPDFFGAFDANLGVNKANLYVSRQANIEKRFEENGVLRTIVRLLYANDSPSEVFPGGGYKNYLRVILPSSVLVEDMLVDGRSVLGEAALSSYGTDKTEIGFFVEVPPQSMREVQVVYTLRYPVIFSSYELFLSKQPGEREGGVELSFKFPSIYSVKPRNFKPSYIEGIFSHITDSSVDRIFIFDM